MSDIIQLPTSKPAPLASAYEELLHYILWSMKQEQEPHALYEDPIHVFRREYAAQAA